MSCPICFEIIPESKYITSCNHSFCKDCIVLNNIHTCPLCRKNIYLDHLTIEDVYSQFQQILHTKSCQELSFTKELLDILKYILGNPKIIEYVLTHKDQQPFQTAYRTCIVENQRVFENYSNKYEDFALTMLFCKYH